MLGGIAGTLLVLAVMAWALILVVRKVRTRLRGSLRYGLAKSGVARARRSRKFRHSASG